MNLASHIENLNATQLKSLSDTIANAGIAVENGGSYREIFRRGKLRRVGLTRRIYEMLEHASLEEIENLTKSMAELEL